MVIELHRLPDLLDHAVLHDNDAVRHGHGLHLVMGDIDGRRPDLSVELADLCPHTDAELCVKV